MEKYTLVGVDGNAFAIMGYTANALKREGQHQTHRHNAPKQYIHPLWRFLQQKAQRQHCQHQPACGNAHVEELEEYFAHHWPPFR